MPFGRNKRSKPSTVVSPSSTAAAAEANRMLLAQWGRWRRAEQTLIGVWNEWLAADAAGTGDYQLRYADALAQEEAAAAELARMIKARAQAPDADASRRRVRAT